MGYGSPVFKRSKHTEDSIVALLAERGATQEQARDIVQTLGERLSPKQMYVWLADDAKSHPVPDDDAEMKAEWEANGLVMPTMSWTPINAVAAGKTHLVLDEAHRFVAARS